MRVVVTGAQGLLGRHLTAALLDAGAEAVLGLGRSPRADDRYTHDLEWLGGRVPAPLPNGLRPSAVDRRYAYERVDLRDEATAAEIAGRFRPDAVLHAASALRDDSWDDLIASNLHGTAGLMRGFGAAPGPPRMVLASTGSIYGAALGAVPFAEDGPAEPIELYGASKRAAEDIARILASESGARLAIGRIFNLIGPGLQDRHLPGRLASRVAAIARGLAPPELALGPLDATRDFVDVNDAARAMIALATAHDPPPIANVASGVETPAQRILDVLLELAGGPPVQLTRLEGRRADIPRAVADVGRLRALGVVCDRPLEATLAEMLAYFDAFSSE
jgi:nucleoside-diphosphate-sugar epimerase